MNEHESTNPVVQMMKVTKDFGSHRALDALDFDVADGERVAIIGPSGSGKTTILRILMGLESATAGRIEISGIDITDPNPRLRRKNLKRSRRQLGYVFQQFNLFPNLTIIQNVALAPIKVKGVSKADAMARAEDLLRSVGLADKVGAYPAQLSGGQQQRVAIARALAMDPQIMLFDEVTSALDPELVGDVLRVIVELSAQTSMTMLLVTHEMRFAQLVANRVVFMDHGKIVEAGSPDQIFGDPKEERTRRFIEAVVDPI